MAPNPLGPPNHRMQPPIRGFSDLLVVAPNTSPVGNVQEFPQLTYFTPHSHDHNHRGTVGGSGENLKSVLVSVGEPSAALRHCGLAFLIPAVKKTRAIYALGVFTQFVTSTWASSNLAAGVSGGRGTARSGLCVLFNGNPIKDHSTLSK